MSGLSPSPAAFLSGLKLTWVLKVRRRNSLILLSDQEQSPADVHRGHYLHGSLGKDCLNKSPNTPQGKSWLSHSQWLWVAPLRLVHNTQSKAGPLPQQPLLDHSQCNHSKLLLQGADQNKSASFCFPSASCCKQNPLIIHIPHFNLAGV